MRPRPRLSSARHALRRPGSSNRGFSLVEIMVALVIGMIGVLVIMQVARTAEAQKRITTGSGNSMTSAALGIHSMQQDIRQAGYGFNSLNVLGCRLTIPARDPLPAHVLSVLAPVTINPPDDEVPAGDAGTDTLLVVHGNSVSAPEGDTIVSVEPLGHQGTDRGHVGRQFQERRLGRRGAPHSEDRLRAGDGTNRGPCPDGRCAEFRRPGQPKPVRPGVFAEDRRLRHSSRPSDPL